MDLPLRVRLLGSFVGVVVLSGALTILAGSFLINRIVISEAERRVVLGLKTARAMWERRLDEALKARLVMAEGDIAKQLSAQNGADPHILDDGYVQDKDKQHYRHRAWAEYRETHRGFLSWTHRG
jgi:hypothetical protein